MRITRSFVRGEVWRRDLYVCARVVPLPHKNMCYSNHDTILGKQPGGKVNSRTSATTAIVEWDEISCGRCPMRLAMRA